MNNYFEEIFNSYDRIIKYDVIEKTIIFIQKNMVYALKQKI